MMSKNINHDTPSHNFIDAIKNYSKNSDWGNLNSLLIDNINKFTHGDNFEKIIEFYDDILPIFLLNENIGKVKYHVRNINFFRDRFFSAYQEALLKSSQDDSIKALYFEYLYDGDDDCEGNIFLCTHYSESNPDWASKFTQVIGGIPISEYCAYDVDFNFSNIERFIADYYVAICLLVECHQVCQSIEHSKYPFAFANHDWSDCILLPM